MDHIENLIEELHKTKDISILSKLNNMRLSVEFLEEGIRWRYIKKI